jgi:hypothetical protein
MTRAAIAPPIPGSSKAQRPATETTTWCREDTAADHSANGHRPCPPKTEAPYSRLFGLVLTGCRPKTVSFKERLDLSVRFMVEQFWDYCSYVKLSVLHALLPL